MRPIIREPKREQRRGIAMAKKPLIFSGIEMEQSMSLQVRACQAMENTEQVAISLRLFWQTLRLAAHFPKHAKFPRSISVIFCKAVKAVWQKIFKN